MGFMLLVHLTFCLEEVVAKVTDVIESLVLATVIEAFEQDEAT